MEVPATITDPMTDIYNQACEYLEAGWSVIPLDYHTRKPKTKWEEYQHRQPTQEELDRWFDMWPQMNIGLVCGAISGLVVVDCDCQEAVDFAKANGLTSPISAKTTRGQHFYFRHPMDGKRYGNHVGSNPGSTWYKMPGLDFRGDGGFVVLPPSVKVDANSGSPVSQYRWQMNGLDWDDCPVWHGNPSQTDLTNVYNMDGSEFDFGRLNLASVQTKHPHDYLSVWDKTEKLVHEKGMLRDGDGRNALLTAYASEEIMRGAWGYELRQRCDAFQTAFFADHLHPQEAERSIRSMEEAERRNHPERFDAAGNYTYRREPERNAPAPASEAPAAPEAPPPAPEAQSPATPALTPFFPRHVTAVRTALKSMGYLVDPWLRPGSFTMIYGYTGHGKSLLIQGLTWALACGRQQFGPYEIARAARVLYMDWENGAHTLCDRMEMFMRMIGDPGENFGVWSPALLDTNHIDLKTDQGVAQLGEWVEAYRPDVVVIDTVRTAWSGLEENRAEAWAVVNQLAIRLRNAGIAVILLHHANKPNDTGLGREAGSTNQLSNVETQLRITQVYRDEDIAKTKAGKWEPAVWERLEKKLEPNSRLVSVFEVSAGKVRDASPNLSDKTNIGYAERSADGTMYVVADLSKKQWARAAMEAGNRTVEEIATQLNTSVRVVKEWVFGPTE